MEKGDRLHFRRDDESEGDGVRLGRIRWWIPPLSQHRGHHLHGTAAAALRRRVGGRCCWGPSQRRRQKRWGGGQRRRSSAFVGLIGEGGRERRMSATVVPVDYAEEDAKPTMIAKESTSVRNLRAKKATVVPVEGAKEEDKEDEPGVDIMHDIDE